ncbi:MAG: hypothetical protein L0H36_02375 [bacterium]|nr:hypothetical protein [bacterium]
MVESIFETPLRIFAKWKPLSIVAILLAIVSSYFVATAPVSAAPADATWKDGNIVYNDDTYRKPNKQNQDKLNIDSSSTYYMYLDGPTANVIYFDAGANPTGSKTGHYSTYKYTPPNNFDKQSGPKDITFEVDEAASGDATEDSDASACKIQGGLSWIICPVTNFLAQGTDWVFDVISGFLEVKTITQTNSEDNNSLYRIWGVMRNFANIAFVIAFLIIIYSQVSSFGMTNYGIKRLAPRLIIAAILVNISYWVCAIAVDLSNILGYSLQDLFITLRGYIVGSGESNGWQLISWESITGFILSGGALSGAAVVGAASGLATLGAIDVVGAIILLLPILLGVLLTILVVLLILAARQAIITILIVIAPLAFVAMLLPNTEKWFDRWRDLFTTLLVMFPAFSLVFGGAQLAGVLIIQNAHSINEVLLGMAVQIAPLAITPLLLKLSGSLVSRIAGLVNNPSRGLLDRTKNWSKDRVANRQAHNMAHNRELARSGQLSGVNFGRRAALRMDNNRRRRESTKATHEKLSDSYFEDTSVGRTLGREAHKATTAQETIQAKVKSDLQGEINVRGSRLHADNIELELSKETLKNQESINESRMADYRTQEFRNLDAYKNMGATEKDHIKNLQHTANEVAINGVAAQSAKRVSDMEYSEIMQENKYGEQERAGGIEGSTGAFRAYASSIKTIQSSQREATENAKVIIEETNLSDDERVELANNKSVKGIIPTEDVRKAAIEMVAGGKNAGALMRIMAETDFNEMRQPQYKDLSQAFADSMMSNSNKPFYATAALLNGEIKQQKMTKTGNDFLNYAIANAVNANKIGSAESIVTQDKEYLFQLSRALERPEAVKQMNTANLKIVKEQMVKVLSDSRYEGRIGDRREAFQKVYDQLPQFDELPADYNQAVIQAAKKSREQPEG